EDLPRNENIKYRCSTVRVSIDGKLGPIETIKDVLARTNFKEHDVQLVSLNPAIVKIVEKRPKYHVRKEQAAKLSAQKRLNKTKEHQMTWNISDGDLVHKMKKAREDLAKGHQVRLVLAAKQGGSWPTREEQATRSDYIFSKIEDVAVETGPRTWKFGVLSLHLAKRASP
ncbi:hypothetical protein M422DRAFT_103135, partial [Sphaerobolus stellatus SS14]